MRSLFKNRLIILLFFILIFSLILNLYGNTFQLGYHADESAKVRFVLTNTQNFKHPIFILQVPRAINSFLQLQSPLQVAILGRTTTAFFGTAIVFLIYKLSSQIVSRPYALASALLTAVSPGIVTHSHYFKEDIAFAFATLLSFLCFFYFVDQFVNSRQLSDETTTANNRHKLRLYTLFLGLSFGLVCAAKYKSATVFLIYLVTPLALSKLRNWAYYKYLFSSLIISLLTFLIINFPIFTNFNTFLKGLKFELRHAIEGHHSIAIYPWEQFYTFHLRYSLIPSLTLLPVILGIGYIVFCLVQWKKINWKDRFFVLYVFIFYFILESSPLKPFPDYERYVVPLIPIVSYFCMQAIRQLAAFAPHNTRYFLALVLATIVIVPPATDSINLVLNFNNDTRGKIEEALQNSSNSVVAETYSLPATKYRVVPRLTDLDLQGKDKNVCTLVASSFRYSRYLFAGELANLDPVVSDRYQKYLDLFQYPYIEIQPQHRSFAFSNPVIRIINVCPQNKE